MSTMCTALQYQKHGDPNKVVTLIEQKLEQLCNIEVLVEMLAAPINPVDINVIQGVYPMKPKLPAVPGNEGVGNVLLVGPNVKYLKRGDRVIVTAACLGTWRTHAVFNEDQLAKVPHELGIPEAATLMINPCAAYRMLKDFGTFTDKDCIIQNGANSACGQNVIQLCKLWGIKNIGIVRDRPGLQDLKIYLKCLGASWILTEEELAKTRIFKDGQFPAPKLALNCIGGRNGMGMVRHLKLGGTVVTYGGMSRRPVTAQTSAFIFKDICAKGFWVTQWHKIHDKSTEKQKMFADLICYMKEGKLKAPMFKMIALKKYAEILKKATDVKGFMGTKYIFDLASK